MFKNPQSSLCLVVIGLAACTGFAAGTIKDACGIAPDAFKAWRETSLARRSRWYAKAEKTVPKLYSRDVKPVGIVKVQPNAAAFQGWCALPDGELARAWRRPLNPGDSLTLDFGEHLVGYLSFSLVDTKHVVDAPVRLRFTFAEVPFELGEDVRKIENLSTLSKSWLQHEVVTVDVVPDGPVAYNRTVSLTGNLRLVKDGAGIFVAMKQGQTYNGAPVVPGAEFALDPDTAAAGCGKIPPACGSFTPEA